MCRSSTADNGNSALVYRDETGVECRHSITVRLQQKYDMCQIAYESRYSILVLPHVRLTCEDRKLSQIVQMRRDCHVRSICGKAEADEYSAEGNSTHNCSTQT